jgi:hypothetical protein
MEDHKSDRQSRFGSQVASDIYARLKRLSVNMKVLKVYDIETTGTVVKMTIFNSWMITRDIETGAVGTFERNYSDGLWYVVEPDGFFRIIPVWPIVNLSQGIAYAAKKYLLDKLYDAVGYNQLLQPHMARKKDEERRLVESGVHEEEAYELADARFPDAGRMEIARKAFADRLFGSLVSRGNRKPKKGFVSHQSVYNALKGVRAEFHRQFRDKEVFRAILAMERKYMSLGDYVYFAERRDAVLKIWRERRNLVSMLPYINRDHWSDDDLFSTDNWTSLKGLLSKSNFTSVKSGIFPSQNKGGGHFTPFASTRAFRWLARSKSTIVRQWVLNNKKPKVAEFMSELNLPKETAVLVSANIVGEMSNALAKMDQFNLSTEEYKQRIVRTFRSYAAHWAEVRQRVGYRAMIGELYQVNIGTGDVFDYLIDEGFDQGLPARNATWASIQLRSDDWHRRVNERMRARYGHWYDDEDEPDLLSEWTSLVSEQNVNGYVVRPLGKYSEVADEGAAMSHCVESYASRCANGKYRVYSITSEKGDRATLGISLDGVTARLDQVRGVCNSKVSPAVMQVADKVVALYAEALALASITEPESKAA